MKKVIGVFLLAFVPGIGATQEAGNFECRVANLVRRVEIVAEPGVSVPCEVHYYKESESPGEREVLWSAQNEAGYCEARAAEFRSRLEDMGWSCQDGESASDVPAADDTDALQPADDEIELTESEAADGN